MATIHAYNQGRLKGKETDSWYMYYIEVAKVIYEDATKLLRKKEEGFMRV